MCITRDSRGWCNPEEACNRSETIGDLSWQYFCEYMHPGVKIKLCLASFSKNLTDDFVANLQRDAHVQADVV